MIGNCITFAIYDFFKNGGELIMSFHPRHRFPHFAVQRFGIVYSLHIDRMILCELWYKGYVSQVESSLYDSLKCKRFIIASRRVK